MRTRIAIVSLALISIVMMLRAGGLSLALLFFGIWLSLPFLVAYRLVSPPASRLLRVAAILACVVPVVAYGTIAFPVGRQSSTAALGFVFIPIWHFALIGVCSLAVSVFESRFRRR